jgi:hypothetical protein
MFSKEVFKNERKLPDFFAIFVKIGIFCSFFYSFKSSFFARIRHPFQHLFVERFYLIIKKYIKKMSLKIDFH